MANFKSITSGALALSLASASLLPLSSAANAGEGWRHENRYEYAPRTNRWGDYRPDYSRHRDDHGYRRHDDTGKYVALGIFATVLGLALASEQNRVQHRYYDNGE